MKLKKQLNRVNNLINMNWIDVNIELPKTDSQHGETFLSDEVGVWTDEGFSSDKYFRTYDLKGGSGKKIKEGWTNALDVTHWLPITPPEINTKINKLEDLSKRS